MRLAIPTIIFVNKIDRGGAQSDTLIESIKAKLTENVIPFYRAENLGTSRHPSFENRFTNDIDQNFLEACINLVALHDEAILASYVNGETITAEQVQIALLHQIRQAKIYPIFFGSAMTGVGVRELLAGVATLVPPHTSLEDTPLSGMSLRLKKKRQ